MRIGRIFGIDIVVSLSWLFIFAFVAWALADVGPFQSIDLTPVARIGLGVITALCFFASVLIHELAHSLVARSRGIPIKQITLFIFGGVSNLEGEPSTAPVEAWIAFVGPLTSIVLGGVFFLIGVLVGPKNALGLAAFYLSWANVILGVFNLLPAFPLDGGRVLHALIWRVTKSRYRATQIAATTGRVVAWMFVAFGAFMALSNAKNAFSGLWLAFIGWFLLQAGGAERMHAELEHALSGLTAKDIAEPPPQALPADATADFALQLMMKTGYRAFPVMLGDQLLGILTMSDFAKLGDRAPSQAYVTSLMTRTEDLKRVSPTTDANEVLRMLSASGLGQIPVMDDSGKLVGFVTRENVLRRLPLRREIDRIAPSHAA
ncbi:MAG TPA: site-2 protease family protein [Candidatus Acidoferrales bacterium]|nr:site-2 protease family protein [Candidatus Acidoferrales bacterium]